MGLPAISHIFCVLGCEPCATSPIDQTHITSERRRHMHQQIIAAKSERIELAQRASAKSELKMIGLPSVYLNKFTCVRRQRFVCDDCTYTYAGPWPLFFWGPEVFYKECRISSSSGCWPPVQEAGHALFFFVLDVLDEILFVA